MGSYNASTAQCLVYSYKDGLLSKIAHDLKHQVTRFNLRIDPQRAVVEAELDARSLRVMCVMREGREIDGVLSQDDRKKIESQIVDDVLHANSYPIIRFKSTLLADNSNGVRIEGVLDINNTKRSVSTVAWRANGYYQADVEINQPEFGIKPFSAMMGTLKIKPKVLVRMRVPMN